MPITEELKPYAIFDLAAKVLSVSGVVYGAVYGVGWLSINFTYHQFDFHDSDISATQGVLAGLWSLTFVAVACAAAGFLVKLFSEVYPRISRRIALSIVVIICSIIGIIYWNRTWIHDYIVKHYSVYYLLVVMALAFGYGLLVSVQEAKSTLLLMRSGLDKTKTTLAMTVFTILFIFMGGCLLAVSFVLHNYLPLAFGGGRPETHDLWVSADAITILENCPEKLNLKGNKGNDLTLIRDVWVLRESKDNVVTWRSKCPIVSFPATWIRASQWPQYNPK